MSRREDRPSGLGFALGVLGVLLMIASAGWVGVEAIRTVAVPEASEEAAEG